MTLKLHFTPEDWERIERDWTAWWAGELDRPLVMITRTDPPADPTRPYPPWFTAYYGLETPVDQVLDRYQEELEATHWYGDAWPKWWPNFGPGVVASFLGARLHVAEPTQSRPGSRVDRGLEPDTVWFEPDTIRPIDELRLAYSPDNPWWRRVQALTERAVARWGDQVAVGFTDLGGNLDILASLRTTQGLLFDLYDAPEEVERRLGEITRLWGRYYDELAAIILGAPGPVGGEKLTQRHKEHEEEASRAGQRGVLVPLCEADASVFRGAPRCRGTTPWAQIWSPGRCYMLQSDFAYMISPAMFERFVLPDLDACCRLMDHPFYHLDGKGQIAHLDMLLSLDRLAGIQWIPGDGSPPPEEWPELLRRIRAGGKLCQLYVSAEGALRIVRELGGKGFALFIDDAMDADEALAFMAAIGAAR